jgi:PAS domain S-box-containing protein
MKLFSTRLRTRLLVIALLAVLPALAAMVYLQAAERRRARERTLADNLRLVRLAASQQADVFEGARHLLLTLANFPLFRSDDPRPCNELLPNILSEHPGYFNISVANTDGSVFCTAAPVDSRLFASATGRPWLERAIVTRTTAVGDHQISATTGKPAIIVAHPMLDSSGTVVRIIAAMIGLDQLSQIVSHARLPHCATLVLFDRNRTVLARYPDGNRWIGTKLPEATSIRPLAAGARQDLNESVGVDGILRLYVTVPVSAGVETGLYLGMGVDHDTAFGDADRIVRQYLWLLALVSIGAIAAAVIAGDRFVLGPIATLKRVTDRIAGGDLGARAELASDVTGISDLRDAVNAMAAALDARQQERDRAESDLRQSEDRYRLLFEQHPHPMWVYDLESLQFLEVNQAAIRSYGYSRDEFLAMQIIDIRPPEDLPRLAEDLGAPRDPWKRSGRWRHRLKSGDVIDVEITSHTLTFGGRSASLVTAQDVTDRTRAESASHLLAAIVSNSEDAIVSAAFDGTILSWNAGAEKLYGYTAREVIGRSGLLTVPADRHQDAQEVVSRVQQGEHFLHYETIRQRKDGSQLPVAISLSPIRGANGHVTAVSAIIRDLSERERAQRTLRESEERFRQIAETVTEVFWMADVGLAHMAYVSPAYERIWGRSCESLYQNPRSFLEAVHVDDRERVIEDLNVQQLGQPFDHEYRIVRPDGEVRIIWDRGFPVRNEGGRVRRYVGVAQDVTDRRHAEERIRLLARAVESTNEMVSVTDLDNRFTFVNSAFLRTYGYTEAEVLGQTPAMLRPADVPAALIESIGRETRRGGWQGELMNRRKDGSTLFVSLDTSPILDQAGRMVGLLGVARDITERLRAERALEDAEERMRFALEASRVGVWEVNFRTGISHWSESCELMHGLAPGTFGGTFEGFFDRIHPEERDTVRQIVDRAIREHTDAELEYQTVWPDGTVRWINSVGRFFYDEAGLPTRGAGVAVDITERRSLEAQLRQAQKMDAIGQLAGGVAHDFNNLLTAILGYSEFLADSLPESDERRADVDEIRRAAERAAGLTRQLLAFSRKQILTLRPLHVGDVVGGLTPMLRRLLGETIDLKTVTSDHGRAKADAGQLEQVLVNLAVNARDAMREGGRLTIETADVWLDDTYARRHPSVHAGPHVCLAVSDTGHGMDAATQKRVFEPFFTTKPKGEGTGLGLATVYGIVKQSGGHIWVYSEVGHGTTFKVYLPRTDEVEEADRPPPTDTSALRGVERILLVEDEEVVREFAYKVLSRYGYTVHAVDQPSRAIDYAASHRGGIDVLLSDVVLPEMSGRALANVVQQEHPEAKVLYMSGYTDHAIVRHGVLEPGTWFLQKPFSAEALARKVRQILDGSRSDPGGQDCPQFMRDPRSSPSASPGAP